MVSIRFYFPSFTKEYLILFMFAHTCQVTDLCPGNFLCGRIRNSLVTIFLDFGLQTMDQERSSNMKMIDDILNKRPKVNIEAAVNRELHNQDEE